MKTIILFDLHIRFVYCYYYPLLAEVQCRLHNRDIRGDKTVHDLKVTIMIFNANLHKWKGPAGTDMTC